MRWKKLWTYVFDKDGADKLKAILVTLECEQPLSFSLFVVLLNMQHTLYKFNKADVAVSG